MKAAERQADLEQILGPVREEVEAASALLTQELSGSSARVQDLVAHVSRFRGKRLRSAQVLLVGKGFGKGGAWSFFLLWLFAFVGYFILGFGRAQYTKPA